MMNDATKHGSAPRRVAFSTLAVVLLALVSATNRAQSINRALHGSILDPSRAVKPRANLEVRNLASGELRRATVDETAVYIITGVTPGRHSVLASKFGFSGTVRPDIELQVSQGLEVNYAL